MTRTQRPIPLVLTGLIALFSALLALALSGGHAAAHGVAPHDESAHASISDRELGLRNAMRKLWEDHVTWTRLAVIGLIGGTPDTQATVSRLLRNQTDIGNAIKPFYGRAAGNQLTALLRQHILIAADVIAAAKAGDQKALTKSQAHWGANANQIARFLNRANPRSWKLSEMRAMLHEHLALTTNEVVSRLQRRWAADVANYERIHIQALEMADMLSSGIVSQFPGRFS
ncbi:MAG: hypothetical protein ACRDO9_07200 [Gaiellales bacterium]